MHTKVVALNPFDRFMPGLKETLEAEFGELPPDKRQLIHGNGSQPGLVDLFTMIAKTFIADHLPAEKLLSLHTCSSRDDVTFVLAPQRTMVKAGDFMEKMLVYKRFLDSGAPAEMMELMSFEDTLRAGIRERLEREYPPEALAHPEFEAFEEAVVEDIFMQSGLDRKAIDLHARYREVIEPLSDMFDKGSGTPMQLLAATFVNPEYLDKYYHVRADYPTLNILPPDLDPLFCNSKNLPPSFVPDDILDIAGQCRQRNIPVRLVYIRSRSFMWPRDLITWVDDGQYIAHKAETDAHSLSQNGMVVNGKGKGGCFVIISNKARADQVEWLRQRRPDLKMYTLPSGFVTIKYQGSLFHNLNSHIDSVVNILPGRLTNDGRSKLLVDPQYYRIAQRELDAIAGEQDLDIVQVDDEELQLQMPNFALVGDAVIINKGPRTLRKANIRQDRIICPGVANTEGVFGGGLYRCQSNYLPHYLSAQYDDLIPDEAMTTEEITYWQYITAFGNQQPRKDVLADIAAAIRENGIDRSIVNRAFREYAQRNDDKPPTWMCVRGLIDRMNELKA